jgi:hypothetical protein
MTCTDAIPLGTLRVSRALVPDARQGLLEPLKIIAAADAVIGGAPDLRRLTSHPD